MACDCRIAGIERNSIVDGVGLRYVVFFQGCLRHCDGCHNPETWDFNGGKRMTTADIIADMAAQHPLIKGLTLSGGEPMMQPKAALELARAAKELGWNVWCWTGYTLDALISVSLDNPEVSELLSTIDYLVDGSYRKELRTLELPWRGSSNQRVINMRTGEIS